MGLKPAAGCAERRAARARLATLAVWALLGATAAVPAAANYHFGAGSPMSPLAAPPQALYAAANYLHASIAQPPLGASSYSHCALSVRPMNASASLAASLADSYLSNYVTSGRREQYAGAAICITARDVDEAVEEAKASLGGYVPKEIYAINSEVPKPMQVTVIAEIVTQATRILANKFKLPESSILYDLPALDISKSRALDKICPVFLKPKVNCEHAKYRTLSGFCNNLDYQSWGATRSAMVRFLAPDYYDSISLPRRAYDGSPLPSARVVSFVVHQDPVEYDKYHSMLSVVWGQFIDHDMTLAVQASDEEPTTTKNDCCKSEDSHPNCFPIEIPKGDPFYGYFNQRCIHFMRASAGLQPGCSLGPVQAMNKISSYMDGNLIYGASIKTAQRLRAYYGGLLKTQPVRSASAYGAAAGDYFESALNASHDGYLPGGSSPEAVAGAYKPLLPPNKHQPDFGCERRGRAKDVYCFEAGDARANEQIQLTSTHTLLMREHNRVATALQYINQHWNDERLFQEARQIVVAQLQHITFNEFLPLVIGKDRIYEYGLELERPGKYYRGYDTKINAGVRVEFQAAAFRYGHSILPSNIERYNKFHQKIESIRLSKLLKQPYDLYHPGVIDTYLLGLVNQRAGRMDPTLTTEVTNHLFEKPGKLFGIDLAAINIQRGRDMGVPGYNHFRDYCGLPRAKYFEDLSGVFSNKTLLRLSQLYKHVDDIDLWTAGISEYPIQDGLVGPTFACLIARQFVNLRRGDRFWYENAGYPAQFTIEQLDEIRKSTAARLICDNSDDVETIQASAMLVADPYTNPRVACASLPYIDLSKWREYSTQAPPASEYPQPAEHQTGNALDGAQLAPEAYLAASAVHGNAPDEHYAAVAAAAVAGGDALADYESRHSLRQLAPEQHQLYGQRTNAGAGHRQHHQAPSKAGDALFVTEHLVDANNYRAESRAYQESSSAALT